MFKDTFGAKNEMLCSLLTATTKSTYYTWNLVFDFKSNPSPGCSLPLVFDDIKKDNINLVLLKD